MGPILCLYMRVDSKSLSYIIKLSNITNCDVNIKLFRGRVSCLRSIKHKCVERNNEYNQKKYILTLFEDTYAWCLRKGWGVLMWFALEGFYSFFGNYQVIIIFVLVMCLQQHAFNSLFETARNMQTSHNMCFPIFKENVFVCVCVGCGVQCGWWFHCT